MAHFLDLVDKLMKYFDTTKPNHEQVFLSTVSTGNKQLFSSIQIYLALVETPKLFLWSLCRNTKIIFK